MSTTTNVPRPHVQDELKDELAEIEDEQLQERLAGAERAPVHTPVSNRVAAPRREFLLPEPRKNGRVS
jgi:hypothetical protein